MTFAIIMNPIMYVNDWYDHIRCLSTFEKRSKLRIRSWVSLFIDFSLVLSTVFHET